MTDWINESSAWLFATLVECSLKLFVLVAATLLTGWFAWKASASVKHQFWMTALLAAGLLPVASVLLPAIPILSRESPTLLQSESASVASSGSLDTPKQSFSTGNEVAEEKPQTPLHSNLEVEISEPRMGFPSWIFERRIAASSASPSTQIFLAIWILGAGSILSIPVLGYLRLLRLRRQSLIGNPRTQRQFQTACEKIGLVRQVDLKIAPCEIMPMTFGWLSPVVLLPKSALQWSNSRLRMVLLHELTHVKRRDCLSQLICTFTCAFYWFHPAIWIIARRLYTERESACDDAVLKAGCLGSDYATLLLKVSKMYRRDVLCMNAGIAMSRHKRLHHRVDAILNSDLNRSASTRRFALLTFSVGLIFMGLLAAIGPVREATATAPASETERAEGRNPSTRSLAATQVVPDVEKPVEPEKPASRIYIIDRNGENLQLLADETTLEGHNMLGSPVMSHDGKFVVFDATKNQAFSRTRLIKVALDGPNQGQIVDLGTGLGASFSTDDKKIAYFMNGNNPEKLERGAYIMNSDGTQNNLLGKEFIHAWGLKIPSI